MTIKNRITPRFLAQLTHFDTWALPINGVFTGFWGNAPPTPPKNIKNARNGLRSEFMVRFLDKVSPISMRVFFDSNKCGKQYYMAETKHKQNVFREAPF